MAQHLVALRAVKIGGLYNYRHASIPAMKTLIFLLLLISPYQSEQTATVYFYRVEEAPRMVSGKPKLRINNVPVATFPEREFIGLRLPPGRYVLQLGQPQSATALIAEAGKTYYVQVSYMPGGHGFNGLIDNIIIQDVPQAMLHFEQIKRALEDKNIKLKNLGTISAEVVRTKPPE